MEFPTIILADLQSEAFALPNIIFEQLLGQFRGCALYLE
jgi:hypothetical protein